MEGSLTDKTPSEIFHEAFPEYIAMGMSYREFWELDSSLVKDYRRAHRIKQEQANYNAWLTGLYVLNALNSGVPVSVGGFAKHKVELPRFPEQPIDFEKQTAEEKEKKKLKEKAEKMREFAERFNQAFRKRNGTSERKDK